MTSDPNKHDDVEDRRMKTRKRKVLAVSELSEKSVTALAAARMKPESPECPS